MPCWTGYACTKKRIMRDRINDWRKVKEWVQYGLISQSQGCFSQCWVAASKAHSVHKEYSFKSNLTVTGKIIDDKKYIRQNKKYATVEKFHPRGTKDIGQWSKVRDEGEEVFEKSVLKGFPFT